MSKKRVLLLEPNYKNKYPPMGLMKLAMYHRLQGFDVRFYKGDLRDFAVEAFADEAVKKLEDVASSVKWASFYDAICAFIKKGVVESESSFETEAKRPFVMRWMESFRKQYLNGDFPEGYKYDRILVTTLFTFYWDITVETINGAKKFLKSDGNLLVGGILATVLAEELEEATGIRPHRGILNVRKLCKGDRRIGVSIDDLPLDYSIVHEIDYSYPAQDAYFAYTTRGCVNKCPFCVVPKLEPEYKSVVGLKRRIRETDERFGPQRDLLLLDNNVLASEKFPQIIKEIQESGFEAGATFIPPNQLEQTIRLLESGWNDRAYIRKGLFLINEYAKKLTVEDARNLYSEIERRELNSYYTAKKQDVIDVCRSILPGYTKRLPQRPLARSVDFNQGLDARLFTDEKAKMLGSISIRPLRVAFDSWNYRGYYVRAMCLARKHGIRFMSNYLLYNHEDAPIELFHRLKLNNELNEMLDVTIYSFPMKYQPITDPEYFANRKYIGKQWTRKQLRSIQAILNVTHGQVGRGYSFFQAAFGRTEVEYLEILRMPDAYIKRRWDAEITGAIESWRDDYSALTKKEKDIADKIVAEDFIRSDKSILTSVPNRVAKYLSHYKIAFEDVKSASKEEKRRRVQAFNESCQLETSEETDRLVKQVVEKECKSFKFDVYRNADGTKFKVLQ